MGTNYYSIKKCTNDLLSKVEESLKENKYADASSIIENFSDKTHIGKSSYGWKFLFNPNEFKRYSPTRESINSFIGGEERIIVDEYDNEISINDFWKIVDNSKDGVDNNEYYKNSKNSMFLLIEETCMPIYDEYKPQYYEFYSDGLRFSTHTDFS